MGKQSPFLKPFENKLIRSACSVIQKQHKPFNLAKSKNYYGARQQSNIFCRSQSPLALVPFGYFKAQRAKRNTINLVSVRDRGSNHYHQILYWNALNRSIQEDSCGLLFRIVFANVFPSSAGKTKSQEKIFKKRHVVYLTSWTEL